MHRWGRDAGVTHVAHQAEEKPADVVTFGSRSGAILGGWR